MAKTKQKTSKTTPSNPAPAKLAQAVARLPLAVGAALGLVVVLLGNWLAQSVAWLGYALILVGGLYLVKIFADRLMLSFRKALEDTPARQTRQAARKQRSATRTAKRKK